jgi:hypothetical protein
MLMIMESWVDASEGLSLLQLMLPPAHAASQWGDAARQHARDPEFHVTLLRLSRSVPACLPFALLPRCLAPSHLNSVHSCCCCCCST